jgi:hypothetical protein
MAGLCFKALRLLAVICGLAEGIFTHQNKGQVQFMFFVDPLLHSTKGFIPKKKVTLGCTFTTPEKIIV